MISWHSFEAFTRPSLSLGYLGLEVFLIGYAALTLKRTATKVPGVQARDWRDPVALLPEPARYSRNLRQNGPENDE